ncbi:MAG: YbaB/EbfC family nucleoid-associated protein [Clostridia bacterium]|jgi:DNA-binding YbaB/EbfC family protein|nr:YbaB/EbfC family nucleoid-associated protein [Clostridia bacterium]
MKARLPQGVGGGPQNMNAMIRQAQKLQEDMEALQAELDAKEYDVSAGGGAVKIRIKGTLEILNIEIAPEIVDPDDIETLTDLVTAAVNEAISKVTKTNEEEKNKLSSQLNIPGIF